METKILIVVQARIGSSRLPGKVLLDLEGKPLLVRLIERISRINTPARIVVATTTERQDDRIEEVCRGTNVEVYRGHPTDLLDRHYQAAIRYKADFIAKIPSDCPLIDPEIIDKVFRCFISKNLDYISNLHPASYPDGNDVEIMTVNALSVAWRKAKLTFEREHTTPYIWERPDEFRMGNVLWDDKASIGIGRDYSMTHRWTIDYPEDYELIKKLYGYLFDVKPDFSLVDILSLLESRPEISQLNSIYVGVNWYRHHLDELKTVTSKHTRLI